MKNNITKNYIYSLLYQVLSFTIILISTPYLSKVLGVEMIGTYSYTFAYATFFVLMGNLGVTIYGQREIAFVHDDPKKRTLAFWEIKIIHFCSFLLSTLVFFFVFCLYGKYKVLFRLLLLEIIGYSFDVTWFFQGLEEFKKTVVRNSIVRVASLVCIFIFVKCSADLWKYIVIVGLADVLGFLVMWAYLPAKLVKFNFKELNISKRIVPMLVFFLPQIALQIYTVLDKSMLGLILNDMTPVGYYEQAQKILKTALTILTPMGTVILSRMSIYAVKNEKEKINQCLYDALEFIFFLGVPIMFGLIAISNNLIPWFFGAEYGPVGGLIVILSPIVLIMGLDNILGTQYLVSLKRQKEYTTSIVVGCCVNVVLNLILIRYFKAVGASIASIVAEFVVLSYQYNCVKKDISLKRILLNSYKYIISGIIMLMGLIIVSKLYNNSTIYYTVLQVIIGGLIYGICLIIFKDNYVYKKLVSITKKEKN